MSKILLDRDNRKRLFKVGILYDYILYLWSVLYAIVKITIIMISMIFALALLYNDNINFATHIITILSQVSIVNKNVFHHLHSMLNK